MIEYVVPGNIDRRILERAARTLEEGGLVGLPTDSSWIIACSMKSREGLKRLRRLSGEREESRFTLLCADIAQFGELASMDNTRFRLIKRLTPGPYVFLLRTLLGTEKALGLRRREIGARLPDHALPRALVVALGCPLYSVTAKRAMTGDPGDDPSEDDYAEDSLFEGGWELDAIPGLDLILDTGEERPRIYSTVLDLREGDVTLVKAGAGPWPA